ncbi:radical SAM protein, partial [Candidatus Magnetobacterium casensis]|nr:radical SAM protein [Candidatus Magnetobacterium casensis]
MNRVIINQSLAEIIQDLKMRPTHPPARRHGNARPQFLGIIPTRRCNISCAYCGFGAAHAEEAQMKYSTAVDAIKWLVETAAANGEDTIEIHFFGGEPFLAGDLVDVAVHRGRAEAAKAGLIPRFEAATNGVFNDDRLRFVGEYFDTVVLSFDGVEDVHNLHRPKNAKKGIGSYAEVAKTAYGLGKTGVELCFRTCVSHANVGRLADTSKLFSGSFTPNTVCFETLQPNEESEAARLRPPDPYVFTIEFMQAVTILESAGIKPLYSAADTSVTRDSFCPVGRDAVIVSPDGRLSSCYLPQDEW